MNEAEKTTMHIDNKSEINERSLQVFEEILHDPTICQRLEEWRRIYGRTSCCGLDVRRSMKYSINGHED